MCCGQFVVVIQAPACHVIIGFTHTTLYLFSVSAWALAWGWFIALSFAVLVIAQECDRQTGIILYKPNPPYTIFTRIRANEWRTNKRRRFVPRGEFVLHNYTKNTAEMLKWIGLIPKAQGKMFGCLLECSDVHVRGRICQQTGWSRNAGQMSLVTFRERRTPVGLIARLTGRLFCVLSHHKTGAIDAMISKAKRYSTITQSLCLSRAIFQHWS